MNMQPEYNTLPEFQDQVTELQKDRKGLALASLVLGLVGIILWIIPIFAYLGCIPGLVFGILGRKSTKRGMAIAGIILNCVFLIAAIINSVVGALLWTSLMS